jgi:phage/plasmid-associated DNA primase
MTVIRSELKVMHEFPHIPADYIPAEFQHLKLLRITFHTNGCLLWFEKGETHFISNTETFITQREFYATQTLPSVVDENADMSPFVNYVADVMGGKENAEYFLKLVSTVLATKRNIYRKAIIFFGGGQNGKNSTIDIIKAALGDLVQQTPSAAIIKAGETLSLASLYKLKDSAIAYIDETPDKNWNTDIFKAVTGSWSIVAKRYYRDPEDMKVTFLLIILTNHLPKDFERQSQALEDRFVVIKFPFRYADVPYETQYVKKRNPALIEALMANTAATIQAFRHYYKVAAQEGFVHAMPPAIVESTDDIRLKANSVGFFIQSCVVDDPSNFVYVSDLYNLYKEWCKRHEVKSVKIEEFREHLKSTNFRLERTGRGYICHCVRLKTDFLNGDEPEPTPTPSLIASDNGSDDGNGQDYLDEFPF